LSVLRDMFWTCYTSILMSTIFKICRDFFKKIELFMTCIVRIARVHSATPRPMLNSALRVGSRDRDFKPWLVFAKFSLDVKFSVRNCILS